jgi:hypothetical protein
MLGNEVPIDSLVRDMKRGRSYTLGLGKATPLSNANSRSWATRVARSLHDKTQRNTLLIETDGDEKAEQGVDHQVIHPATEESPVAKIFLDVCSDPESPKSPLNRQAMKALSTFPAWKEEFPLIVLHLGSMDSDGFAMLGKLCDGIALAADLSRAPATSLRDLARNLRHHQTHGCRLLGMWSVEIG